MTSNGDSNEHWVGRNYSQPIPERIGLKSSRFGFLLAQMCYLYQVANGIIKTGYRRAGCLCWLHGEFHTEFFQSLVFFLNVVDEEHRCGNPLLVNGFLVGSGGRVVVRLENQLRPI